MQLSYKEITWITFIGTTFSMIIGLVLLWALSDALERIEDLEKEVYGEQRKKVRDIINQATEEDSRPYRQCKACGSIVRTNEDKCPQCGLPYDDTENQ